MRDLTPEEGPLVLLALQALQESIWSNSTDWTPDEVDTVAKLIEYLDYEGF